MPPQESFDALSALAPLFQVRPELQSLCRFADSWASPHEQEPAQWAPFHLVTGGACILHARGPAPVTLYAGDMALLPHGLAHIVRGVGTRPSIRKTPNLTVRTTSAIDIKSNIAAGHLPDAELICGRLAFEQPQKNLAAAALPGLMILRTAEDTSALPLRTLLLAIRDELETAAPGARAIAAHLACALLVALLRLHLQRHAARDGLLRLLARPHTARAVDAMLRDPSRAWSLDALAAAGHTSRATLTRDFRKLADTAPLAFLTELRLGLARQSLLGSRQPLAEIAGEAGYESPSAFTRAFHRRFGMAPGEARRGHNAQALPLPAAHATP